MSRGLVLRSIGYSLTPIFAVPLGKTRFWALMAVTTSCAERFWRSRALRSRSTETTRCLPPYGYGTATPGTLMRPTRTVFKARSKVCCSESVLLLMPYCKIGTVEALYWMINGGVGAGGSCLRIVFDHAGLFAKALPGEKPRWKKTFMTATLTYQPCLIWS